MKIKYLNINRFEGYHSETEKIAEAKRVDRITKRLTEKAPDIVIFSEFACAKKEICEQMIKNFYDEGYCCIAPKTSYNGVILEKIDDYLHSKKSITVMFVKKSVKYEQEYSPGDWASINVINVYGTTVIGVHMTLDFYTDDNGILTRNYKGPQKDSDWEALINYCKIKDKKDIVIIGDFNTWKTHAEDVHIKENEIVKGLINDYTCKKFNELLALGFDDEVQPDTPTYKCQTSIDHILVHKNLIPTKKNEGTEKKTCIVSVDDSTMKESENDADFSDHATLIIDIDV